MNIADRIKRLRELFGITSNEFAKITGIHPVSIRKYETNKMVPGIEVIDKMCDALKLPRMIFEGFPKSHTNYNFSGDFYQQLFLLLDNQTLTMNDITSKKANNNDISFTINPNLSKYISIKNGNDVIPLDKLSITLNVDDHKQLENYYNFLMYLKTLSNLKSAKECSTWEGESDSENKDKYIARMKDISEKYQFDLMLADHSWMQYMKGLDSFDTINAQISNEIANGGDYYSYFEKLDIPESEKMRWIHTYEDAFIEEVIQIEEYPANEGIEAKEEWLEKKLQLMKDYKSEHPDYPELAHQHAISNAAKARNNNS